MKSIIAVLGLTIVNLVFASQSQALSCRAFGSFESFELTPPTTSGSAKASGLEITDMTTLAPQRLILSGRASLRSFKVKATQPTFRLGKRDMGMMVGQRIENDTWMMTWFPVGTSSNGSRQLEFTCAAF